MVITQFVFPISDTAEMREFNAGSIMTMSARDADNEHLFDDEKEELFCTDIDDDDYRFFKSIDDAIEHVSYSIRSANEAVQRAL